MRFTKVFLTLCVFFGLVYSESSDNFVLELDSNFVVDSIEIEITVLKSEILKDQVFYKSRKTFFEGDFENQCAFLLSLEKYQKSNEFIIEVFRDFVKIKEMEKEQLQILANNMEAGNKKGIVRLYIKAKGGRLVS